jgi:OFA family oxalate/formate antiporter-like MFS transporter
VATLSVFIVPMCAAFGWSRAEVSGAVSLGALLGAFAAPFTGPLFDRHGSRGLLVGCALVVAACSLALAATSSLLGFYAAFGISRLMFSTPFDVGTTAAVAKWFVRRRARAMALLSVSTGLGLAVLPPLAQLAISSSGWRAGWLVLAAVVLVVGVIPQWLLLVRQPEDAGLTPDGGHDGREDRAAGMAEVAYTPAEARSTPALWLLMAYTLLVFPVQSGFSLHQAPHLIERGLSPGAAAGVVSAFSAAVAAASLCFGLLRAPARVSLCAGALLMALGAALMHEVQGAALALTASIVFGTGIGALLTMLPVAWANYFGRAHFGAIRGFTLPAQVGGQALGPLLAGGLRDLSGDYRTGLVLFAVLSVLAAVLALFARPPSR